MALLLGRLRAPINKGSRTRILDDTAPQDKRKKTLKLSFQVLWQNRGTLVFSKLETQKNQSLTSLGSKLLEAGYFSYISVSVSINNY